jgi:DNA mismatch repair protein MutS
MRVSKSPVTAMAKESQLTPMMSQYFSVKKEHPDAIVLFRMGDFYETFYEDAEVASRVLGIALTSRSREGDKRIPLAGVPHHAVDTYIARLVRAGHKVAICDQVEDPREAKGLVKRKVVEVITPGTVTSSLLLEDKENNYLAAIMPGGDRWGIARADLSTGEFTVSEMSDRDLLEELAKTAPSEILFPRDSIADELAARIRQVRPGVTLTGLDEWLFLHDSASAILCDHFKVATLDGFGCQTMPLATGAAGAVISYLRQTQKRLLPHISRLSTYRKTEFMEIDEDSLANLEILRPLHADDDDASLISVLDRTLTSMGGRSLRGWVRNPLMSREDIALRLEAVDELVTDEIRRKDLRSVLRGVNDLERLIARVCCEKAGPRDLVAIRESFRLLPEIRKILSGSSSRVLAGSSEGLPEMTDVETMISDAIKDDAPALFKPGAVVKDGYDSRLDDLRGASASGKQWILDLQTSEREKTGIASLKVGYNKVFGYYIEVSKSNLKNVPPTYVRKQTLVGGERFVTEDLKDKEGEILRADERAAALEEGIFKETRSKIAAETTRIQDAAAMIARLDVLASFAEVAVTNDYVKPEVTDDSGIEIRGGRHPVVEHFLTDEQFVPNDTHLDRDHQILIITGPNMAGKSTFLRQVALIVIMAQVGSFVPASSARIGIVDKVFTRIGATDRVARGQSTFLVEMIETANILNNATDRSLVLLDEVGRGTSTYDGLSIAWAAVEYLHDSETVQPMTLFATHYHELTDLAGILPRTKNLNVLVREHGDKVIFMRKIVEGGSDRSYGIQVARLAGLPQAVIERAKEILSNLEEDEFGIGDIPRIARGEHSPVSGDIQLNLWESEKEITKRLLALDVDNMTPVEALKELASLKGFASGKKEDEHGED